MCVYLGSSGPNQLALTNIGRLVQDFSSLLFSLPLKAALMQLHYRHHGQAVVEGLLTSPLLMFTVYTKSAAQFRAIDTLYYECTVPCDAWY